jgi:hypothetical protein
MWTFVRINIVPWIQEDFMCAQDIKFITYSRCASLWHRRWHSTKSEIHHSQPSLSRELNLVQPMITEWSLYYYIGENSWNYSPYYRLYYANIFYLKIIISKRYCSINCFVYYFVHEKNVHIILLFICFPISMEICT